METTPPTNREDATEPLLRFLLLLSLPVLFLVDCLWPPGVAIWILYLVPVLLSIFVKEPSLPIQAAAWGSLFTILKYYLALLGFGDLFHLGELARPWVAVANRGIGLVTLWSFALIARRIILLDAEHERFGLLRARQVMIHEGMRGSQSVAELGQSVLSKLIELFGAQMGAFFWAPSQDRLIRLGAYAHRPRDDGPAREVFLGEGQLGQAARDRKPLVLNDLPPDYPRIRSELGEAAPSSVLVYPFSVESRLKAMIEIASFRPFSERELSFLRHVEESIAIALTAAEAKEQLQAALQETQAQAEELRANNEELEKQAEELKQQHDELECQQAEVEQHARLLESSRLELERKNEELERANRYKSEFLANVSHELRTPLNAALIFAKLLAEDRSGNLTPEQLQYARTIHNAGNDLLELIGDILDLAKIEAGRLELSRERFRLSNVLESLVAIYGPVAADKGLAMEITGLLGLPGGDEVLFADRKRIEQVLRNLISNAVKFTESGKIAISVEREAEGLAISVSDTGIGIAPSAQEIIFEAFRQANGGTSRKYGGTGLGLSICRELSGLLGGRISLRSELGRGTTFTLHLPASAVQAATTRPSEAPPTASEPLLRQPARPAGSMPPAVALADDREDLAPADRVVLVIEDDPSFAKALYNLAHELGFKCVTTSEAREGLDFAIKNPPHAIILDVMLPESSGIWVLEQLKQTPSTRHIPVHVVSISTHAHAALAMGAIGYLLKPVSRAELVAAFRSFENNLSKASRRVLVVEDDEPQRESICLLIGKANIEVAAVSTGSEALRAMTEHPYDCVILDLSLPDMSGFELLERLAGQAGESPFPYPPVIVYTGRELSRQEERQLLMHSHCIVIKGARSPDRLISEVTLFLHSREAELSAECQQMLLRARAEERPFDSRTILIADDDPRNVFALASILERRGAGVLSAKNGKEALEKLKTGRIRPDLVLMDIMMPEMDGYQTIREIRRDRSLADLPIIAVTAKAMKGDHADCLAAGANDYVSKPVDVDRLLSLIRVLLPRRLG